MDIADIKNKPEKELHDLLSEKRDELRELRFKVNERQLKDVRSVRKVKKSIAQILTLLKTKINKKEKEVIENKDVSVEKNLEDKTKKES